MKQISFNNLSTTFEHDSFRFTGKDESSEDGHGGLDQLAADEDLQEAAKDQDPEPGKEAEEKKKNRPQI